MKKKLLLLGGSRYLYPVIKAAHELGLYVITCDYLPDNDAHKVSDEYVNVSIIDKDAVLEVARDKRVSGVMSFACDPGVVTAAYVAEYLGLPFQCSYEAACILQDKGRFRQFLSEHGFNCPRSRRYTAKEEALKDAIHWVNDKSAPQIPVMVKPVDSAGSKGCTRVNSLELLPEAIDAAIENGHNGAFIIEDYIIFESYHSSADPFTIDGKLHAVSYSDQLFDREADNPYTPAFIIWPSMMQRKHQEYLTSEIQRLMDLLRMRTGIYNIETCVGQHGIPYIMEVSPRGGGCKIAEIQQMAFGANLIENEVRKAVGMPLVKINTHPIEGHWCEMIIHSRHQQQGILEKLVIRDDIAKNNVRVIDMSTKIGDIVYPFTGANRALGDMFLQFSSREELNAAIEDTTKWLNIVLK